MVVYFQPQQYMKKYTISLSFQCNEDWNKMTPTDQGRHCQTCNKVVTDFTSLTDTEIINYLLKNKNSCGRFKPSQLNRTYTLYKIQKRSNWPAIAAMLIAGFVSVVPSQLNAMQGEPMPIEYSKENKKVEPDKTHSVFTVQLMNAENKAIIYTGGIFIDGLGTFLPDVNGEIKIIQKTEEPYLQDSYRVSVYASGFNSKYFTLSLKDLKKSTHAIIYLDKSPEDQQMTSGTVSIHEN